MMTLRTVLPVCLISLFFPASAALISSALAGEVLTTPTPTLEPTVAIEQLPPVAQPAPLPSPRVYSTLPGWSAGYRYNFNADNNSLTSVRLFLKHKTITGHSLKVAWQRQTGVIPNFFKTGTIDGVSFGDTGTFYVEQEIKF